MMIFYQPSLFTRLAIRLMDFYKDLLSPSLSARLILRYPLVDRLSTSLDCAIRYKIYKTIASLSAQFASYKTIAQLIG